MNDIRQPTLDEVTHSDVEKMINVKAEGLTPATRRTILRLLGSISVACIFVEGALLFMGLETSDSLLTIAATCTGGLAGMAQPGDR